MTRARFSGDFQGSSVKLNRLGVYCCCKGHDGLPRACALFEFVCHGDDFVTVNGMTPTTGSPLRFPLILP